MTEISDPVGSLTFQPARVVVMGQGYVGLPLAMRAVEVGHTVVGFEVDEGRSKRLAGGESFVEDISDQELAVALASGRYLPTTDPDACAGFDIAVITVPTPLLEGVPHLGFIEDAGRILAPFVRPGCTVILESTTYPGTTEELLVPALEAGSHLVAGADFHVGFSPERIDPGNPVWTFVNTPKVVSGIDGESLGAVQSFYDGLVERTVAVGCPKEAELVKLLENTFRHVNIALVNELAVFAAELGIDIWAVIDATSTKPFGFMPFTPGPGVGGHCLPIDPSYLAWRVERKLGRPFRFVALAKDVNDHMPDYVVQRLLLALNQRGRAINGSRVLLLGLSYKRNSADARESPAIGVAERLVGLGAVVRAADPHLGADFFLPGVTRVELTGPEVAAADAVVVLTDHDAFDREVVATNAGYVFDTRNWLPKAPAVEYL
ncbi:MAG: nucleotide sugar dehydrogenase [Actinomycetota bacterium]|nr:nucleotide sugar dehydrogenase [Actinomycetota bacterium]